MWEETRRVEKVDQRDGKYSQRIRKTLTTDKETESMWGKFLSKDCNSGCLMALYACYVI